MRLYRSGYIANKEDIEGALLLWTGIGAPLAKVAAEKFNIFPKEYLVSCIARRFIPWVGIYGA